MEDQGLSLDLLGQDLEISSNVKATDLKAGKAKVAVYTLGCKLNYADGLSIRKTFEDRGYEPVDFEQGADVYIINTCSVTEKADRKCARIVRQALKHSPQAKVVVVGCYAQLQPEQIARIPGVHLVAGTDAKWKLPELLQAQSLQTSGVKLVHAPIHEAKQFVPAQSWGDRTRAFLKVQDGCDFPCTYCTIPMARGMARSDTLDSVVVRAQYLANDGVEEIVLTGVNLGDFGRGKGDDRRQGHSLAALVRRLHNEVQVERLRLSSVEPNLFEDDLIAALQDSPRFVPHFHIPLQSGSDAVLRRMRRRYTTEDYRRLLLRLADTFEGVCLGADVMVGFAGESESEFLKCYEFLESLPLAYLHVFTYSERPGTLAADWKPVVPVHERLERNHALTEWGLERHKSFVTGFSGRVANVLFEQETYTEPELSGLGSVQTRGLRMRGYTPNYIRVECAYDPQWVGASVPVHLGSLLCRESEVMLQGTILN
ncbi:MAG: tRNA (N(6)-L-threonylcarbamoyladenosine(37)-C(2))-methylthiotransferase MtaB [Sphingomonadales bacterium]|nr:tRNA (N(6)-L-threonylcarbamoyladenosine(37)-C(2))-methylthiotransferase MtaB [Sphingomonadales bacterium]